MKSKVAVGCVVVDPADDRMVASSGDMRHVHPLKHAPMVCIEMVAQEQLKSNG